MNIKNHLIHTPLLAVSLLLTANASAANQWPDLPVGIKSGIGAQVGDKVGAQIGNQCHEGQKGDELKSVRTIPSVVQQHRQAKRLRRRVGHGCHGCIPDCVSPDYFSRVRGSAGGGPLLIVM